MLQDVLWFISEDRRLPRRFLLYLGGCALLSLGVKLFIDADLGTDPLHAMVIGIVGAVDAPLVKIGLVESLVTGGMLAAWSAWNRRFPPLVTFVTMALVGHLVDLWNVLHLERFTTAWLAPGPLMLAVVVTVAYGSALIIMSGIGIRVVDLLAITLVRKLGWRFLWARLLLEFAFVLVALLTGGPLGAGTVGFLVVVGTCVAPMIWANNRYLGLPNHGLPRPGQVPAGAA